jgi:hypothetical protein
VPGITCTCTHPIEHHVKMQGPCTHRFGKTAGGCGCPAFVDVKAPRDGGLEKRPGGAGGGGVEVRPGDEPVSYQEPGIERRD